MKAVVLRGITPAEDVRLSEVPLPQAAPGRVVVRIRAFGLNHSEKILRLDEIRADYIRKPVIPGIECAGEIADGVCLTGFFSNDPDSRTIAQMMDFIRQHDILPPVGAVYPFAKIREACMALDGGEVNGKIVVTVP